MNGSQVALLAVAAANLALLLLFPPYDSVTLGRGSASFDAFYFVFDAHFNKAINANLLLLQIYWVLINAAPLRDDPPGALFKAKQTSPGSFRASSSAKPDISARRAVWYKPMP